MKRSFFVMTAKYQKLHDLSSQYATKKTLPGGSQLRTLLLKVKPKDKHDICLPSIMLDKASFVFVAKSKASILCLNAITDTAHVFKNFLFNHTSRTSDA